MDIVILLLPLALLISGTALGAFVWASLKGQYDDLETPAYRILIDEEPLSKSNERNI